jgi:hypothetical protein
MWDLKAQENIAAYIVQEGHIPKPLGGIYRPEYTSYPAGYIIWAVLSEFTSIPTSLLMTLPSLTYALYTIFLWITLSILRNVKREYRPLAIALLGSVFIAFYKLPTFFIYQRYGRVMLLLSMYLTYKALLSKKLKLETSLMLILFIAVLMFSHSESSIAYLVIIMGLLVNTFEKTTRRHNIILISIITFVAFALYLLWGASYFATTLINMLKNILTHIFSRSEELLTLGFSKYTPIDYTLLELVLFVSSLVLMSLTALIFFLIGVLSYLRFKKLMLYLGPLTSAGSFFILLFWFSPYKSDISFKFITALSAMTALSSIELSSEMNSSDHFGKHLKALNKVLITFIAIIMITGFSVYSYRELFSSVYPTYYNFALHLEFSGISLFLANARARYIIIDSPSIPYYFIRDYIDPRFTIPYSIVLAKPETIHYSLRLINGMMVPRTLLILQKAPLINMSIPLYEAFFIGEPELLIKLERVSLVYNTGIVSIGNVNS